MLRRLLLLALCAGIVPHAAGLSGGAPDGACVSMTPSHGYDAQTSTPPVTLTVTKPDGSAVTQYSAGETLKVTITPNGETFQGFLIRARRADSTLGQNVAIGTFAVPGGDYRVACSENSGENGLTHTRKLTLNSPLELEWTAPSSLAGHLEFRLTVVKSIDVFWTNIKQTSFDYLEDPTAGPISTGPPITEDAGQPLALSDCESNANKGCFTRPNKCTSDCEVAVIWTRNGNGYDFQMSSQEDYVALGFSADEQMGDDSVIECVRDKTPGAKVQAGNSKNDGQSNAAASPYFSGITDQTNGYADGEVRCRFTHSGALDGNRQIDGTSYYLFLASGSSSGLTKNQHTKIPFISDGKFELNKFDFLEGTLSKPWLIKIHGALMMIAWVACASIGIVMARYYKEVWPNSTLCSQKVWFTIHRTLMVSVVLLTVAGFIVIFVHVEDWSHLKSADSEILKAHPYLGVIVTALAITNPIMALFRPHPGEPNRVYFNWAHWGVGTLAHTLSIFAVFLGLSLPSAEGVAPDWLIWVMVGFVAFHVITDIILEVHKCTAKKSKGSNTMEMQQMGESPKSESSGGDLFRQLLLFFYILVVVALAATLTIVVLSQ